MHVAYRLSARILGASAATTAMLALSHAAFAFSVSDTGLDATARAAGIRGSADLPAIVGSLVGAALTFIGVVFLVLMIYGGFLWMNARGNEQQVEKAKNLITAAIIGLVIISSGYAITNFVLSKVITATGTGDSSGGSGSSDSSDDGSGGGSSGGGASGGGASSSACRTNDDCAALEVCTGGRCVDVAAGGAGAAGGGAGAAAGGGAAGAGACVPHTSAGPTSCPPSFSWTGSSCCPDAAPPAAAPGGAAGACVPPTNPITHECPVGTGWRETTHNCCPG